MQGLEWSSFNRGGVSCEPHPPHPPREWHSAKPEGRQENVQVSGEECSRQRTQPVQKLSGVEPARSRTASRLM